MGEYLLYYTLNKDINSIDLTIGQKTSLLSFLRSKTLSEDKKKAIILLICEHARFVDGHDFDPDNFILPYDIYEDKSGLHCDIDLMPVELKRVLYKFSMIPTS